MDRRDERGEDGIGERTSAILAPTDIRRDELFFQSDSN
jgi:hypothetical protein